MSLVWLTASFGYYLIATLINMFDDPYETALTSAGSEMLAYLISGLFYERIGVKTSLILSYAISTVGGIAILSWGLQNDGSVLFLLQFLMAKFGVTCAFNITFAANAYFFPVLFAATAMGVCNFLARLFSSFSFVFGRMEEPIPMILFTILVALSSVAPFFLVTTKKENKIKE